MAELTLEVYMNDTVYEDMLGYVVEITDLLEEINEDLFGQGGGPEDSRTKREAANGDEQGPWEDLAIAVELLVRNIFVSYDDPVPVILRANILWCATITSTNFCSTRRLVFAQQRLVHLTFAFYQQLSAGFQMSRKGTLCAQTAIMGMNHFNEMLFCLV